MACFVRARANYRTTTHEPFLRYTNKNQLIKQAHGDYALMFKLVKVVKVGRSDQQSSFWTNLNNSAHHQDKGAQHVKSVRQVGTQSVNGRTEDQMTIAI